MLRQKLHIIRICCRFVRLLIKKILLYPVHVLMLSNEDIRKMDLTYCDDILDPLLLKMNVDVNTKHDMPHKATGYHAPVYYADPLSVTYTPTHFLHLERLYFRRYFNKHRLMRQSLARKIKSFFKRWNDNMNYHLTLLFGLSNIRPANLYDAIFGSSSYRIH